MQDVQQIKMDQLQSQLLKLQQQFKEVCEIEHKKQQRNEMTDKEVDKLKLDLDNFQQYVDKQIVRDGRKDQSQIQQEEQARRALEKKFLDKFNFHMDKYYQYIDGSVNPDVQKTMEIGEQDNQYQAPPPTYAIQVKCLKSNFGKKFIASSMPGDDEEYVMATFRYSKKCTLDKLKLRALQYWRLIEENVEEDQNNRAAQRFELVAEDLTPIGQTDIIERYLSSVSQNPSVIYFTVVLRRRKTKQKKKENAALDKSSQDPRSQVKSGTHTQTELQSTNAATKTNQQQSHVSQSILSKQSEETQQLNPVQEAEEEEEDQAQQDPNEEQNAKIPLYQAYTKFFKRFPLIRKMFIINKREVLTRGTIIQKQIKLQKKGMVLDDHHVCVMLLLVLLLILNSFFIYFLDDGAFQQSHIKQLKNYLKVGSPGESGTFLDVKTMDDLQMYLSDFTGLPYQLCDLNSPLSKNYENIGAIRIRQVRVKETQCKYPKRTDKMSQVRCSYEYQMHNTIFTDTLGDGKQDWNYFQPRDLLGIQRNITGTFGQYDSSGYIFDIKKKDQNLKYYSGKVIPMLQHNEYFTFQSLATIISFTLRCKNDGNFFFLEFLVEYTSSGVFPQQPNIIPFVPNIFGTGSSEPYSVVAQKTASIPENPAEQNTGIILYAINILKVFGGIAYTFFILMKIVNHFSDKYNPGLKYFISITFILNALVIFTTFYACASAFNLMNLNLDSQVLQNLDVYFDLGDAAYLFQAVKLDLALNVCVLILRIFIILSFFKSLEAALQAIESQYLQLLASFIILAFNLLGFAFVGMTLWGAHLADFSSILRTITSLITWAMGCFDKLQMQSQDLTYGIIYIVLFYFLLITFMFNMLAVIYIDSYRLLVVAEGELKQEEWSKTDWFYWAFSWVPKSFFKSMNDALEAVQE